MKDFFELTDDYRVTIAPWMMFVPEFNKLIKMDKGSDGDYRGDKKLKASKQLAFCWFMISFKSPIIEWEPDERKAESLRYTGLLETDITDDVWAAHDYYDQLQIKAARSLVTLRHVKASLTKLDDYFKDLDFSKVDKQGKLLHSTKEYMANLAMLDKMYTSVDDFEKRVYDALKADTGSGARGDRKLGGKEGTREAWVESGNPKASSKNMTDLEDLISSVTSDFTERIDDVDKETGEVVDELS